MKKVITVVASPGDSLNKWNTQLSLFESGFLSGCFLIVGSESLML